MSQKQRDNDLAFIRNLPTVKPDLFGGGRALIVLEAIADALEEADLERKTPAYYEPEDSDPVRPDEDDAEDSDEE